MIELIKGRIRRLQGEAIYFIAIFLALVVLMITAGVLSAGFLTFTHLMIILSVNTMLGILALAQTLVILSGGIDISIGSIFWIVIMAGAVLMGGEVFLIPFIICIGLGAVIGMVNGVGISRLKVHPVIMTLAMAIFLTGALYITTGGGGKGGAAPMLINLSTGRIFGFPIIALVWISLTVLFYIIMKRTTFGRRVRALGSNPQACLCSGMNIWKVQVPVYIISGALAALAALFYLGWARIPYPVFQTSGVGMDYSLQSIAAVVIGGTFFSTGRGNPVRTFIGVLILVLLFSILSMVGLGAEWQMMLNGLIIICIVAASGIIR